MKLMRAFEFGSAGAVEIFSFTALFSGKGMTPLRLAPGPRLIPLQAEDCEFPFTIRFMANDLLAPGLGLVTVTAWLPEARSCVALTKLVVRGTPDSVTCAPRTK